METLKRELERALIGQIIVSVKILWPKTVMPLTPTVFQRRLKNRTIESVERRAKILFFNLDNGAALAIHLKMTGQLIFRPAAGRLVIGGHPQPHPFRYTRAIFSFADGSTLYFNDLRKFGWLKLMTKEESFILLAHHGLEPFSPSFTLQSFRTILNRYPNRRIKQILLDQTLVAGLGNIYADESCFAAGVKPARRIKTLIKAEVEKLYRAIKRILQLAIKHGGTSTRNYVRSDGSRGGFATYLKVYGRTGKPCRCCKTPIKKLKLNGRGTHYCSYCQK